MEFAPNHLKYCLNNLQKTGKRTELCRAGTTKEIWLYYVTCSVWEGVEAEPRTRQEVSLAKAKAVGTVVPVPVSEGSRRA